MTKHEELTENLLTYCIKECVRFGADFKAINELDCWSLEIDDSELANKDKHALNEAIESYLIEF